MSGIIPVNSIGTTCLALYTLTSFLSCKLNLSFFSKNRHPLNFPKPWFPNLEGAGRPSHKPKATLLPLQSFFSGSRFAHTAQAGTAQFSSLAKSIGSQLRTVTKPCLPFKTDSIRSNFSKQHASIALKKHVYHCLSILVHKYSQNTCAMWQNLYAHQHTNILY